MIRTIIIDDEPRNIKFVDTLIREHCPQLTVVGSTDDLWEVANLVNSLRPSLLLLDIEFPAGNIFTVLEELPVRDFHIIFITAHNTYAAEAFKQNAIDYLLKPVTKEALVKAIKKVEAKIDAQANAPDIPALIAALRSGFSPSRKIPLPSSDGILFINEAEIIRCEASGRYSVIFMKEQKKLTITRTLKELEEYLNPALFYRVHNSHIINLDMIKKYHRGRGGMAELTDGSMVDVASARKDELLNMIMNRSR
jgi:two-component system, LytTR family, response regulator